MTNPENQPGTENAAARPDRPEDRPSCPGCGSADVIPIVYGFPGSQTLENAKRGLVSLGGCVISSRNPQWHCSSCRHEWGGFDPESSAE